jgi:hypothetical protein
MITRPRTLQESGNEQLQSVLYLGLRIVGGTNTWKSNNYFTISHNNKRIIKIDWLDTPLKRLIKSV